MLALAPIRRRLFSTTAAARFNAAASPNRPPQPDIVEAEDDGLLDEGTGAQRSSELSTFLHELADSTPAPQPSIRYKHQSLIRPTDFHRDTRKRLELTRRRRSLPTYGAQAQHADLFVQLGIDPRREAANPRLLGGFLNTLGRILPRSHTGLSTRSQRLLAKAVKRSKMMGVLPWFSNPRTPVPFANAAPGAGGGRSNGNGFGNGKAYR